MADEQIAITEIANEEVLYRSVKDVAENHKVGPNGELLLKHSAFNDPGRKPSVDRKTMRADPELSKRQAEAGVVAITAQEVRSISNVITLDKKQRQVGDAHAVDVFHRPVDGNGSHSQVEANPEVASDSAWKRLKEALCQRAQARHWVCAPASLKPGECRN